LEAGRCPRTPIEIKVQVNILEERRTKKVREHWWALTFS
jgi:hypothetical protein